MQDGASCGGGGGGEGGAGGDSCLGDASASFERCTSTNTIECFSAVLNKCREQHDWSMALLERVRAHKRYPHTSFFQQHYGAPDQVNCRTRDLLQNVDSMNTSISPALMADIYQANLRFQIAIMNLTMTNHMLEASLKEFMGHVNTYESLVYQQHEYTAKRRSGSDMGSADGVSSTSIVSGSASGMSPRSPSVGDGSGGGGGLLRAIQAAGVQISRHMKLIPTMLNQIPLLASPLAVELRLMGIYDNYDDSPIIHRVLTNGSLLSMIQPADLGAAGGGALRLPPLIHSWDKILAHNMSQHGYDTMMAHNQPQQAASPQSQQQRASPPASSPLASSSAQSQQQQQQRLPLARPRPAFPPPPSSQPPPPPSSSSYRR